MKTLGIMSPEELRQVDHKAVIARERFMRETEHAAASTIRRRLAARAWADNDRPMFPPLRHNGKCQGERRHMDPDAIDRVMRKYAGTLGLDRGYSAHSMRATFITTALENGAQLEDVQRAAGQP